VSYIIPAFSLALNEPPA